MDLNEPNSCLPTAFFRSLLVIERVVRGLYFHHFQEVIGNRAIVRTQWLRELSSSIREASLDWNQSSMGGDQFVYRFQRAEDSPLLSVWIFQFHRKHWAGGHTTPVDQREADAT